MIELHEAAALYIIIEFIKCTTHDDATVVKTYTGCPSSNSWTIRGNLLVCFMCLLCNVIEVQYKLRKVYIVGSTYFGFRPVLAPE